VVDGPRLQFSEAFGKDGRRYTYVLATRQIIVTDPTSCDFEDDLRPAPRDGAGKWFTVEQIAAALPAPLAAVGRNWPLIAAALDEQGLGDRATTIAALATVKVEVGSFEPIEEYRNADGSIPNGWYGYDGGAGWHGRGFIQLTHRYNYVHFGAALGVDLANNPNLALDPTIAARVLALYFKEHDIQALAAIPNWIGIRRAINGGTNGWQTFADAVDALVALP